MKPADLPFLVVHARIAWPIAIVILTAVLSAAWFLLRARYRRWTATSRARWRIAMTEPVDTGTRMLRGVLRGGSAVTGERNTGLWLDCDGARVDIAAALHVAEGSTSTLDRLADGDHVLVQGAVRRDGERWLIEPPAAHGAEWWRGEMAPKAPVLRADTISAWAESPPVPPTIRVNRAIAVIACAGVAYGGLRLMGHVALESLGHGDHFEEPPALGALSVATVVAATRDDALSRYRERLRDHYELTETEVRYQLAVAELQDDCVDAVEILIAAGYWDQARQRAHTCGDQDLALKTALLTGRFDEVAPNARLYWRGFAAIARHDWAKASEIGDELANKSPSTETACLREYLHKKAGRPFDSDAMLACDVVRGTEGVDPAGKTWITDILHGVANGCTGDWSPHESFEALDMGHVHARDGIAWLGNVCPASKALMSLALRTDTALIQGNPAAISHELDEAAEASDQRIRGDIEVLRALVKLRTDAVVPFDEDADRNERGHPFALRSGRAFESNDHNADALRAAAGGDGGPLAEVLLRCRIECPEQLALIGVLPRIRTKRAAVLTALRIRWFWQGYESIASPFDAARYAGLERDIARLARDAEAEHRWQAIVDTHAPVYGTKDVLVALMVWAELLQ